MRKKIVAVMTYPLLEKYIVVVTREVVNSNPQQLYSHKYERSYLYDDMKTVLDRAFFMIKTFNTLLVAERAHNLLKREAQNV